MKSQLPKFDDAQLGGNGPTPARSEEGVRRSGTIRSRRTKVADTAMATFPYAECDTAVKVGLPGIREQGDLHSSELRPVNFFTVDEVAEIFNVSERTVRRWIAAKKLVAHRFGTAVRIAGGDLKAFIANHRDI